MSDYASLSLAALEFEPHSNCDRLRMRRWMGRFGSVRPELVRLAEWPVRT